MDTAKICLAAVTGVCLCVIVKQWRSDFLPLLRLAVTVLFAGTIISLASPLVAYLREMTASTGLSDYAVLLFKALGIAILTQCASDICRDAGESGVATGVELAGKTEILILCLPLLGELFTIVKNLLALAD